MIFVCRLLKAIPVSRIIFQDLATKTHELPTWVSFSELEFLVRVISSSWNFRSLGQYDNIQIEKSFKFNAFSVV